jgi:hypothetical protein
MRVSGKATRQAIVAALIGVLAVTSLAVAGDRPSGELGPRGPATACVYSYNRISILRQFDRLVGREMKCALVYNDAAPSWSGWEQPWFTRRIQPDLDWGAWATKPGADRQLVITQNLFPRTLNNKGWLVAGARGDYTPHAKALAQNLVRAGLGHSVIRLAHEANGTWYPYSLGKTQHDFRLWRQFWRRTVIAMRSVPGAHFKFDWCVNGGPRPIPLSDYYPGDDVVDVIGVDAYDAGVPRNQTGWQSVWSRPNGLNQIVRFAQAHDKPISVPEWGIAPRTTSQSAGDDPQYVNGIASLAHRATLAYQSYFYAHAWASQLRFGKRSLAAYRLHFGAKGDAAGR